MPNVQYDETPESSEPKKKLRLPSMKFGNFGKTLLLIVVVILSYLLAAVLAGVVSALSANVDVSSVSIIFDPQITIAYLLVYYTTSHFYSFTSRQNYIYFLATLVMSFTTNFIQGAIVMLLLPPLLKKLKLIETADK